MTIDLTPILQAVIGLIAALMAVAIIACLTAVGPQMKAAFGRIGTTLK